MVKANTPLNTDLAVKVLAVQFNQRELEVLRQALEAHAAEGSRVTVSQLVRWAVMTAEFDEMPAVP